jgi:glycosyltransferase involved in cell wall biosynthesis
MILRNASGALVISKLIEERVREISLRVKRNWPVYRLPVLVDVQRFAVDPSATRHSAQVTDWFVWCGAEGWITDVLFLVRVLAAARILGYRCRLKIVGSFKERSRKLILDKAAEAGIPSEDVNFAGYVDDFALEEAYRSARALLLPLWNDDRSKTRMPNKLGEYLATGRPVVTCGVGDLTDFLFHGINAYLAEPGSEQNFAQQLISIIRDPEAANEIGAAGQAACRVHLDYRAHSTSLARWLIQRMDSAR